MIFRQLIDPETSSYSYLLADEGTREAILIDPVLEQLERDRVLVQELDLVLLYTLETHVHADHVTSSGRLREALGSKIVVGENSGVRNADLELADGDEVRFGRQVLQAYRTRGHTSGCMTYVCQEAGIAFTGDSLLIRGCGRTDFQGGDPGEMFRSVRERIFALPDDTLLYPAHDYKGRTVTTVAEEKRFNPRIGLERSRDDFLRLMGELMLAHPKRMDVAVPANLESGIHAPPADELETSVADVMESRGRQDAELWMGMGI